MALSQEIIGPHKVLFSTSKYSYFFHKSLQKHILRVLLMSTNNICFDREMRKTFIYIPFLPRAILVETFISHTNIQQDF